MSYLLPTQELNRLIQSTPDQLLEQLGMRLAVVTRNLPQSAELTPRIVATEVITMGITEDLKELGERIVKRWQLSAYQIVCGSDPEDNANRAELKKALEIGEAAAIGALSATLIGVGLMPALAPVLAAILVKKFYNPAFDEFCTFWKSKLPM